MCRMIMALGNFSAETVLEAAINMSTGISADHDGPISCHPNGWGMIWNSTDNQTLSTYRNTEAIAKSFQEAPLEKVQGNFLAIHVRHATIAHKVGLQYVHPVEKKDSEIPWYMLHNGFLPTVYEKLGYQESFFDSKEYCDYVIPNMGDELDENLILDKLNNLREEGSSANAIIVNPKRIYLVHWSMPSCPYKKYFLMHTFKDDQQNTLYIASEIQAQIGSKEKWEALSASKIYQYRFDHTL